MESGEAIPDLSIAQVRETEFPSLGQSIYLNAASVTPLPERSRKAVTRYDERRSAPQTFVEADFVEPLIRSREEAARLIGASPDEIALGGNTSFGIHLAALALPLDRGPTIVVSDREFPANVYPWMLREGANVEIVPADARGLPDEERLLERLDGEDVSIFALSSIQFATGFLADLPRFGRHCRERGIYFVVDAIQSLGQVPLDVRAAGIDILAAGGHKWLCAPFGTGFSYIRRELRDRMEPPQAGWTSMEACQSFDTLLDYRWGFVPEARKFEVATLPLQAFIGFAESMGLLNETGVERIHEHLLRITDPLVSWLQEREDVEMLTDVTPRRRNGIVAFRPPESERVYRTLRDAGIQGILREGAIRLSPHLYNTAEEIERVVEVLTELGSRRWS